MNGKRLILQRKKKENMTPKQSYNALLAHKVIKELKNRNIQGFYYETKEEALKNVIEILPKDRM